MTYEMELMLQFHRQIIEELRWSLNKSVTWIISWKSLYQISNIYEIDIYYTICYTRTRLISAPQSEIWHQPHLLSDRALRKALLCIEKWKIQSQEWRIQAVAWRLWEDTEACGCGQWPAPEGYEDTDAELWVPAAGRLISITPSNYKILPVKQI